MKKLVLIVLASSISLLSRAQKQNIQSAMNYYRDKDYPTALQYINKATQDPSTEKDPKAWLWRGEIYSAMQKDPANAATNPYREAASSYLKVVELKPDYEKASVDNGLMNCLFLYYNDGVKAYNDNKYDDAFGYMKNVLDIAGLEKGKRFAAIKTIDTISAESKLIQANSAVYGQKPDEALPILIEIKNNPIVKRASIYTNIIDIYGKKKMDKEYAAAIEDAKKQYPNDDAIRTEELNYYIKTGKQADLLKKLEENAAKEPNNPDLSFDLATFYQNMAFPKDGKKPANYDELVAKAESSYQNALRLNPENTDYHYNLGALYFNEGTGMNDQMNDITGTSKEEQKKYDDLKKQRDALFDKSLPHLEKVYNTLDAKASTLNNEEKSDYHSSMIALKQIYAIQNKLKESEAIKTKLQNFK